MNSFKLSKACRTAACRDKKGRMHTMLKLQRSTPQAEGVNPRAVHKLLKTYDEQQTGVHSILILRHNKVIAEAWWYPYRPDFTNMLFSLSKSFTSTAIGFAVQEGRLTINDRLVDFFPDVLPEGAGPCEAMKKLTVRDMLRMATGHVAEPEMRGSPDAKWVFTFLSSYIEKEPGTHYLYNTAATYMLSAIVQKLTGEKVVDYLKPRLFEPLGFGNYWWEESPEGITTGGSGFNLLTEDIAKFGVFLLNKGRFGGKQLLDPAWIEEATAKQIDFDGHVNIDGRQGYGYQFWRCQPQNSYRGAGAFGQFCIVLPDQDMVVAVTSGAQDTQPPLTALWEILLPAVKDGLPNDPDAQDELERLCCGLTFPFPQGEQTSPNAAKYWANTYELSENPLHVERVAFEEKDGLPHMRVTIRGKESLVALGYRMWKDSVLDAPRNLGFLGRPLPTDTDVSCSGAWMDPNTFSVRMVYNKSPFCDYLDFTFDECGFKLRHQRKVGFQLRDNIYFGRPVSGDAAPAQPKAEQSGPRPEFRF